MALKPVILILTDFALRIPQRFHWNESFDVDFIQKELEKNGFDTLLTHFEDPCLIDICSQLDSPFILPATSYHPLYRRLVNSTLAALEAMGGRLIPRLVHFLTYENKILLARMIEGFKIPAPKTFVISTCEEFHRAVKELGLPVVIKLPEGFGSSGVSMLKTGQEVERYAKDNFKRTFTGTSNKRNRVLDSRGLSLCLVQEFIPGLESDWKILLFGDKAASQLRKVRPNDFRASGSGLKESRKAPDPVFEFAWKSCQTLGLPWVSADIVETRQGILLLEYQPVHFGTGTAERYNVHFHRTGPERWDEVHERLFIEKEMVCQVTQFINNNNGTNA